MQFGFVEHTENCYAVSQVYCYQQVPALANVSHCFHVHFLEGDHLKKKKKKNTVKVIKT